MTPAATERLFLALWPDETVLSSLSQLRQAIIDTPGLKGKLISPHHWHLTLAFLGELDRATKLCIQQVASTITAGEFKLSLDQLGYWPRTAILWLGASQTPAALYQLVTQLTSALPNCGYRPEPRPFQAHLTLMRKVQRLKNLPPITPITWLVQDFCLVRSTLTANGAHYEIITRWKLI